MLQWEGNRRGVQDAEGHHLGQGFHLRYVVKLLQNTGWGVPYIHWCGRVKRFCTNLVMFVPVSMVLWILFVSGIKDIKGFCAAALELATHVPVYCEYILLIWSVLKQSSQSLYKINAICQFSIAPPLRAVSVMVTCFHTHCHFSNILSISDPVTYCFFCKYLQNRHLNQYDILPQRFLCLPLIYNTK